jgi:peroxiredoxin
MIAALAGATMLLTIDRTPVAHAAAEITREAPAFELPDLSGQRRKLTDYRGQVTVITFISAKCPVSSDYNERIANLGRELGKRGVAFLAINANSDETLDIIRDHARTFGFTFPVLRDADGKVADAYGAVRTPEAYVVDQKGVLRYHGRIDNARKIADVKRSDLHEAVLELLAGKAVSIPETKAFGCLIVRDEAHEAAPQKQPAAAAAKVDLLKPAGLTRMLQESKGRVLLINFWATWCGPCVAEFHEFVAFDEKYRSQGLRVVGISADEVSDLQSKVVPFVKEKNARFDIFVQDVDDPQVMIDLIDKNWEGALPATFVYDRTGKLTFVRYGIIDREQMTLVIEKALKG